MLELRSTSAGRRKGAYNMNQNLNLKTVLLPILYGMMIALVFACKDKEGEKLPTTMLDDAVELMKTRKYQEAVTQLETIAIETERVFGDRSLQYADALRWLAKCRGDMSQPGVADSLFQTAETILSKYPEADSVLAEVYVVHSLLPQPEPQRDYDYIADLLARAYTLYTRRFETCHTKVLEVLNLQASLEIIRDRPSASIPYLEKYLKCRLASPLDPDSLTFANAKDLMLMYHIANREPDEERLGNELLETDSTLMRQYHQTFTEVYRRLGNILKQRRDYAKALESSLSGMRLALTSGDSVSTAFLRCARLQAEVLDGLSRYDEAGEAFKRVYRLTREAMGSKSREFAKAGAELAEFYRKRGDEAKALEIERQATE
jgi:hypothetical protein